jgi:ribonuclease VapC
MKFVLDASAIMAAINREPGWEAVADYLAQDAVICAVNLAEVAKILVETGSTDASVEQAMARWSIFEVPFDSKLAVNSGLMYRMTRSAGLSLGDRACLALAALIGCPAVTTDRVWKDIESEIGVEVILIR